MRLGLLIALTALAAAGRLLLLSVPNVSLTFLVVAVAALAYGPRMGAAVGGLSMLATSAVLGPGPGAMVAAAVVALLGALVGLLRPTGFPGTLPSPATFALAGALGVVFQLAFSVAVDATSWFLFAGLAEGSAALPLLWLTLAGGLLFNLPAAAVQAALFAGALQPTVHALRAAGLAPAVRDRSAPSRARREVVIATHPGQGQAAKP
jgi:hypothetical protein